MAEKLTSIKEVVWAWSWPSVEGTLLVPGCLLAMLSTHRQRAWNSERGGQLFVDPNDPRGAVLAVATPPHPKDRAGWAWLELDPERCKSEVQAFNDKGLRLVGHWHTHPQKIPKISPTDIKSITQFAQLNSSILPNPLAVIVGQSNQPGGIQAWLFHGCNPIQAERRLVSPGYP
ncbi:Mov34/MPN/PAD-1 family protein [Xanthomonas hydrangeae]|uniref:Mov34/MPN/PAD-1 family protein n=1 Tax=Xanthomonas hydrangeae TaxID=2775159 RepID=A0AAU0BEH7_9XANT|nr:Mov34/MPN/PAD-1 family protein [Xanthomonas hydrangeae]WOB51312.1 Mov34/MPN/PAD-1 family protein [Xanthomonas hydrangeae]